MTGEDNKSFMRRFIEEAINRKSPDALDAMVAEDFVEHVPFPGQGPGREGFRQALRLFHDAFPDMHWAVEEQGVDSRKELRRDRLFPL
jgi:hypothetical protein